MRITVIYILLLMCLPMQVGLAETFSNWAQGYRFNFIDTSSSDSYSCPAPRGDALTLPQNFIGMRSCRPAPSERALLYDPDLTEVERKERDDLICECFSRGNTFEATLERGATGQVAHDRKKTWERRARAMSDEEYADRVFGQGLGPAITSMNFADNSTQAEALAGVYLQYKRQIKDRDMRVLNEILNPDSVSDEMCVPPREFIFHEQFPEIASFYDDLDKPFKPEDWDYAKLAEKLKVFPSLEVAEANLEARSILERMRFLLHNPSYKAMFMSTDQGSLDHKVRLHAMLKATLPRPLCADIFCVRTEEWTNQLHAYQDAAREFLKDTAVIDDIHTGIKDGQKLDWSKKAVNTSELLEDPLSAPANEWNNFCEFRIAKDLGQSPILADVEKKYGIDFLNINSNADFKSMNEAYCTIPRRNEAGRTLLFGRFRSQSCSRLNRRECLARFVQEYPYSSDLNVGLTFNINNILEKTDTIAQVDSNASTNIANISQNASIRRSSLEYLEESPSHLASNPRTFIAPDSAQIRSSSVQNNSAGAINSLIPLAQQSNITETILQPQVVPQNSPSPRAEVNREALVRGESDAQGIRNEISSLRDVLRREPSEGGPRDSQAMTSLNQRLASLERRLAEKERENTELRNRNSSADDDDQSDSVQRISSLPQSQSENSSRSATASAQAVVPQGGASGGVSSPTASGNSGSAFSGTSSLAPVRVASRASAYSALLSKYGVRESSEQGSIMVASASGAIDYQQLRSETENSVLPLVVSPEEFNLLSQNNQSALSRYLNQVKALPGEVVRINLSSGDRTLEMYVLKSGDQISFVPAPSVAARAPASVVPARTFTLPDLQNELTN